MIRAATQWTIRPQGPPPAGLGRLSRKEKAENKGQTTSSGDVYMTGGVAGTCCI